MPTSASTKHAAREVADSRPVEALARLGLVARGVIWMTIGLLALEIVTGGGGQADRQGALRAIAAKPFGHTLLVVLVIGFCGYALWRGLEAAVGHRDEDGAKRTGKRLVSASRTLIYGFFAVTTINFLAGGGKQGDNTKPMTARVMMHSGGQTLVGAIGVALLGGGLVIAIRALRADYMDKLGPTPAWARRVAGFVGRVGLVSRGLVISLIGWFLLHAAITFDPNDAKGLDQSLRTVAQRPYGGWLLGAVALGLLMFAVWSWIEARYRDI